MINYGYFRHRFDAHLNTKLNRFVDDVGMVGFAYYYTLLEVYGAHYSQKREGNEVTITTRELANTWRKRVDSVDLILTKLQLSDLLVYTKSYSTYSISIPNFLKYYGSYKKTEPSIAPNKRKENKRKENILSDGDFVAPEKIERNATTLRLTPEQVHSLWDKIMVPKGFTRTMTMFPIPKAVREIIIIDKQMESMGITWEDYFLKIDSMITKPEYRKGITGYLDSSRFMQVMENNRPRLVQEKADEENEKLMAMVNYLKQGTVE